jgi:hypothetical protein
MICTSSGWVCITAITPCDIASIEDERRPILWRKPHKMTAKARKFAPEQVDDPPGPATGRTLAPTVHPTTMLFRPELYWTANMPSTEALPPAAQAHQQTQVDAAESIAAAAEHSSDNAAKDWQRLVDWDSACGHKPIPSREREGVSIPYFSINRLLGFAAYLSVWYNRATLGAYQSAVNHYYQLHGYGRPWLGTVFKRYMSAYATVHERDGVAAGAHLGSLRTELPEQTVEWMLDNVDSLEPGDRGFILGVLIMILCFFRAHTWGSVQHEDDIYFDPEGNLVVVVRALKGQLLNTPELKTVPKCEPAAPQAGGAPVRPHARARLFESIRKAQAADIPLRLGGGSIPANAAADYITNRLNPDCRSRRHRRRHHPARGAPYPRGTLHLVALDAQDRGERRLSNRRPLLRKHRPVGRVEIHNLRGTLRQQSLPLLSEGHPLPALRLHAPRLLAPRPVSY